MNEKEAAAFGPLLRRFRNRAGLTQEELAERAGLSAKAVSALERGVRRRPYPHTVRSLAEALGLREGDRTLLLASVPAAPATPAGQGWIVALNHQPMAPLTGSVGRDTEVADLVELLGRPEVRLVTISGPGGVGKTHLAHRVAASVAQAGDCDATVVSLAAVVQPELALPTVAHAVGLTVTRGAPLVEALAAHFGDRPTLLVLDNVEQIVAAGADVAALASRCATLTVLTTSRSALRVRGEYDYVLAPLAVPATDGADAEVAASAAGALFLARAAEARPDWRPDNAANATIARICRRLDGLPLAIEIVAAQLRYTDPATLLARLNDVLDVSGPSDLPSRQRTLRATLRWSHEVLETRERQVFRRLGVLLGSWTLADAEAAVADGEVSRSELLWLLGRLVEQSLVVAEHGPEMRYRMLEPVRQFAVEQLEEAGESEVVRDRHARWFAALADRPGPAPIDAAGLARHDQLDAAQHNLATALDRLLELDPAAAAHLCWSLWGMWMNRGHQIVGLELARRALVRAPDDLAEAEAAYATAAMEFFAGSPDRVRPLCLRAAEAARRAAAPWVEAYARSSLGLLDLGEGRTDAAREALVKAVDLAEQAGDGGAAASFHVYLSMVEMRDGDRAAALDRLEDVLDATEVDQHLPARAQASLQLGFVALADRDWTSARSYLQRAAEDAAALRDSFLLRGCAVALACLAAADGRLESATRLYGLAEAFRPRSDAPLSSLVQHDEALVASVVAAVREKVGDEAFDAATAAGSVLSAEAARAELLEQIA